jgi:hypothetical protein
MALLKLLAGMLGCGLDELIRRDNQRWRGQLMAIMAASLAGMVLMGGPAAVALAARHAAETQRAQAEGLIPIDRLLIRPGEVPRLRRRAAPGSRGGWRG